MKKRVRAVSKPAVKRYTKPKTKAVGPVRAPLRGNQPFVMRYYDVVSLNTSSTAPAVYVMAMNGMYDPNITSTGHQPRGFDEMMALYENYYVTEATIRFSIQNFTSENTIFGININNSTSVGTTIEHYIEAGNTHYKTQGNGGAPNQEVFYTVDIAKFLGKKEANDDSLQGSASSNPQDILYAHCFAHGFSQSLSVNFAANIEITFKGYVTEQRIPPQS